MMENFWTEQQIEDLKFFHSHYEEYVANPLYHLKFLLVSNKQLVGISDTSEAALKSAVSKFPQGGYIIQQVLPSDEVVNFLYPAVSSA